MNLQQAVKMAWKSIWGKKGRSALTILGIFIGIAAVMTIVSVMEGMKLKTMEQFEAMGSNRITAIKRKNINNNCFPTKERILIPTIATSFLHLTQQANYTFQ